ncbi:MAG: tyrosine-protein phosphatase [Deltaproteobacteria bacterium]|nr:tyrosine-protein phosphatase [Deltaproteobacteria bacterium]MBW2361896.1 tyrosine-protein phosphatase [Deltaproteobacteria bacterium]
MPRAIALLSCAAALLACSDHELYAGMPQHVERRHVVLEGAHNFRDLGGYPAADGRSVRWGRFYRSDALADLTAADLERVAGLGLKLVCDFRGPDEKADAPDRLPAENPPQVAELEIDVGAAQLREKIFSGDLEEFDLVDANRQFARKYVAQYAAMFERITREENLPVLVHCTGGKDRAGFASALILRSLGVPLEVVFEDFLLTNHYTADRIDSGVRMVRLLSLFRADEGKLRALMGVERENLEAAFESIDEKWGSFDAYRREGLGVSDAGLLAFRELALE